MARSNLFFFGHHKCATRYIISICDEVNRVLGLTSKEFHNDDMFAHDLPGALKANPVDFVYYSNAKIGPVRQLGKDFKGIHVIRDPRDIIVSAYFSHRNSHPSDDWPKLVEIRNRLLALPLSEGLMYELELMRPRIDDIADWDYEQSTTIEIKFEDLIVNPYDTLFDAFMFIGLARDVNMSSIRQTGGLFASNVRRLLGSHKRDYLSLSELAQVIRDNSFSSKTKGRRQGEEDAKHHYRKGVAGDWRQYFERQHIEFFKENYNRCLIKLGYEKDIDWAG